MTLDEQTRVGNTLLMLHDMGYKPVDFNGVYDMYEALGEWDADSACVSINYLFTNKSGDKLVVEFTKNGYCAIRKPLKGEAKEG